METQEIINLVKARSFTKIGVRQAKRLQEFFVSEESFRKCSEESLNLLIYITCDISMGTARLFSEDTSRSKKVMFYRKANNILKVLSKAHRITQGATTQYACDNLQSRPYTSPVWAVREEMANIVLNNSPQQG